ncbi:hypothetical protein EZV62_013000 [Acer yangbiense]|uniref:Myb-related protein 123 n=1 Tax=Acer yangbiense TaxID=1000413 RepID=A0A5C7HWY4_9ROSI|nr:hypothetical protein EZV62_013000 [Acer yangbiense]
MGRSPCCSKEGLNKGAWTAREDDILRDYITLHGEGRWRNISKKTGLMRSGKSCRLRWLNYLRPDIKRGNISPDEEELIIRLHKLLGNRWSLIAGRLPGRTDNEIKNYWNTNLVKRVQHNQHTTNISANSSPNNHHRVFKTKAIKCNQDSQSHHKIQHFKTNPDAAIVLPMNDHNNNKKIESDHTYSNSDNNSSDFRVDLINLDDFSFSDLLNSDFSDLSASNSDHHHQQPLVFTEEMLQDNFWTADIHDHSASDLNSFPSIFESRRE